MPTFTSADDLLAQRKVKYDEIEKVLTAETYTPEDLTKVEGLKVEAENLTKRYDALMEISKNRESLVAHTRAFANTNPENPQVDHETAKFEKMSDFLYAVAKAGRGSQADKRLTYFKDEVAAGETKDLNEGVGADGGFLVPTEFRNTLLSVMTEGSIIRPRATVIPMARREMQIPVLDQTDTTEGKNHFFGGIEVFWQAEATEKGQSEPNFRQINLVAHKMVGYTRASDELLADSAISLEAFLTGRMGFAGAIAWKEDYSFINGNGVGQPLGILNSAATLTTARQVQADVTYEDLLNMQANFFSPSNRGMWIASQSLKAQLMGMNGPTGFPQYLWGDATNGSPSTLLGYPITFSLNNLPRVTTTSNGDLMLVDPTFYLVGDRQNTTIESTKFDRWRHDQTSWRAVHRVDGQPWLSAPLTSTDGVTQVSPFVILGAKTT